LLQSLASLFFALTVFTQPLLAANWSEAQFAHRPLAVYPSPSAGNDIVGSLTTYQLRPGDTLLDVGRWYGLSGKEVSDANNHLDWWAPPAGQEIILPTEHILPPGPRVGVVLNIPEMRLYYYPPGPRAVPHRGKLKMVSANPAGHPVVYTFPVGLGRFDWKTPVGNWRVVAKTQNPTWNVPDDIYQEHLERDGVADHFIPGGDPDNPLGHYRLSLSLPEYALHGTNVPWGVGMNISHGCVRLYPEDIERLYSRVKVGTPGRFVYEPVKFGWRGDALFVEVHDDLYAKYPGLWNHAMRDVQGLGLGDRVDTARLEKAVELRSGIPTYVGTGPDPGSGTRSASLETTNSPSDNSTIGNSAPSLPTGAGSSALPAGNTTMNAAPSAPASDSFSVPDSGNDSGSSLPTPVVNDDSDSD
jgi:L,D-transpeptidase ErfK/SrfK